MLNCKYLLNKCKSTPTIVRRARKTFIQDNQCTPYTSRANKTSLVETIRNVIKEVNSEKECISNIVRKDVEEELQNNQKNVTELIQSKLQGINKRLDKISADLD